MVNKVGKQITRAGGNLHRTLQADHIAARMSLFLGLNWHTEIRTLIQLGNITDNHIRPTHGQNCTMVTNPPKKKQCLLH